MKLSRRAWLLAGVAAVAAGRAEAQAIIDNGTVQLGINPRGNLITSGVGLTYLPTGGEALAPGCDCEGWGVGDLTTGETGYAGQSFGIRNVDAGSLTVSGTGTDAASTGDSAVSVSEVTDGALNLRLTHSYSPSASPNLYQQEVLIENIAATAVGNLIYRRAMDWDVPPTEFSEYVTLQGWPAANLFRSSDDGFITGDITAVPTTIASDAVVNGNFTDSGPADHGAVFDFAFGSLAAGATEDLTIFYGAAASEADALLALSEVGAEVYSLGQPSTEDGETLGTPNTFIFGFAGVGGTPINGGSAGAPVSPATDVTALATSVHRRALTTRLAGFTNAALLPRDEVDPEEGIRDWTVHLQARGTTADIGSTANNPGLDVWIGGVTAAIDRRFVPEGGMIERGSVGLQYGMSNIEADLDGSAGALDGTFYSLTLYGETETRGGLFAEAMIDAGLFDYDQKRNGVMNVYRSDVEGHTFGGLLRVGHSLGTTPGFLAYGTRTEVKPYGEVSVNYMDVDGYREDNDGLRVDGFDQTRTDVGAGLRVVTEKDFTGYSVFGAFDAAAIVGVAGDGYSVDQTTAGGATIVSRADDRGSAGLRLDVVLGAVSGETYGVSLGYSAYFSGDVQSSHGASIAARFAF